MWFLFWLDVTKAPDSGQPITYHKTNPALTIGHLNISLRVSERDGERHCESWSKGREQMSVNIVVQKLLSSFSVPETKGQRVQQMGRAFIRHAEHRPALSAFSQPSTKRCAGATYSPRALVDGGRWTKEKLHIRRTVQVWKHTCRFTDSQSPPELLEKCHIRAWSNMCFLPLEEFFPI